jgi:hypothetical protein
VLAFTDSPTTLYVQILNGPRAVYTQRATDPDAAAIAAEHLWKTFVEHSQHPDWPFDKDLVRI